MEKNQGEPSAIVQKSDKGKAIFSRTMISEENIERAKCLCFIKQNIANDNYNEDGQSSDDSVSNVPSDDVCELPLQKRRELARKPDNVTQSLPEKAS